MRPLGPVLALMLAACGTNGGGDSAEVASQEDTQATAPASPTPAQLVQLEDRDCRKVVGAYSAALGSRMFDYAAMFWAGGEIDGSELEALYDTYAEPRIVVAEVREEGAAGSLYCTVTGALGDNAAPSRPLREGEIVLRRANDVPGATAEQLRWNIRSSTFVEPMERSGDGGPA
jgi:hypothetical protein